eukprot:2287099-Prymnesium_polylepis.1
MPNTTLRVHRCARRGNLSRPWYPLPDVHTQSTAADRPHVQIARERGMLDTCSTCRDPGAAPGGLCAVRAL